MDLMNIALGLENLLCGVLIFGLAIPLYLGRIPPNHFYGIRIPAAFRSKSNWYRVNRYGGIRLMIWSVPLPFLGIIAFFLRFNGNVLGITLFALAPCIVIMSLVDILLYSRRLP